jgi:hypothetical protein
MIARVAFILLLLAAGAQAADIKVISPERPNRPAVIAVTGQLQLSDEYKFQAAVGAIKTATVYLHSQGGDVPGAIQLGWAIRAKHFQTAIMDHGVCGLVLARG